ncbi:MAG: hypothetical protein K2K94_11135, partial [Muribaculaceae bacterium]|nr:hypothetical protein [Muribaculaceae bacterium]
MFLRDRYGKSFKAWSVGSLIESLQAVLENYESSRRIAEGEAYDFALSSFDISETAKKYIDRYSRLLMSK